MPVKIRPELAALRAAAKAPVQGYFSVLDELMQQLPDRPISVEELRQRLKPGRMLQREDMRFPLKQEEIQYALDPTLQELSENITPADLIDRVRSRRPSFDSDDVHNEGEYAQYGTQGPNRVRPAANPANDYAFEPGDDYFATTTDSPDFGKHAGHYNDGTISFSRGSRHTMPEGGVLRLIDEIQNDRANNARQHAHAFDESQGDAPFVEGRLRGWRTSEEEMQLAAMRDDAGRDSYEQRRIDMEEPIAQKVPDAPFKTPQEYGRLEIKNQLLDAIAADDAALGITTASGPAQWFPGTGAKDTTYDKVYPGELRKIAKQYGAPFEDVDLPVHTSEPLNLNALAGTDIVDFISNADWTDGAMVDSYHALLGDLANQYRSPRGYDPRAGHRDALDDATEALEMVKDARAEARIDSDGRMHPEDEENLDMLHDEVGTAFSNLYDAVAEQKGVGTTGLDTRKIPSMMLTPEVKDRIARIGLPLFTIAGAAALSPEMTQESDMPMNDQPESFAGGGVASRATGALRRIREATEQGASRAHGSERAWMRDIAAQSEPRTPAGAAAYGNAGEYGAWAEGPPRTATAPPQALVQRAAEPRRASPREPHALRRRATDAESLAQGYHRYADAMESAPRQMQYFVDANKLKALNDKFGFSAGDRLIELQNQYLQDELSQLDPSVGGIMARGPGDEVFMAGNDDTAMRAAIERANNRLITEGVHMNTPEGKRTISGVASLKYGAGDDLDAAEADLMARKSSGMDDRADASEAIDVLEAPRYRAEGGSLNTMRGYLNQYASGGGVSLVDQYADAVDGEYEDGDEYLGEDADHEYYACGGPVNMSLGGFLKKAVKKVAKVGKVIAPILGKIPGIGTVAAGAIGGLSGLIADGNLKGALSGALSGVSGGLSNGLLKGALTVGSSLLDAKNNKAKGAAEAQQQLQAQEPQRIATVPDFMNLQQQPVQNAALMPSQLSLLQQAGPQQTQMRMQPGSNANGLLSFIQQQQAARQQPV